SPITLSLGTVPVANGGTGVTTLTSNQFAFYNGTGFTTASTTFVDNSYGAVGIGTTSPKWVLNLASSTRPQLTLSDGTNQGSPFTFRAKNSMLYLSPSPPPTFATTPPAIFALDNSTGSTTLLKLDVTGSATSSFSNGVNITNGCFAVNGSCL